MPIRDIDGSLCNSCQTRIQDACPIAESCATDVIRLDGEGKPYIVYPEDCTACFFCQMDCKNGAVRISPDIEVPLLPH